MIIGIQRFIRSSPILALVALLLISADQSERSLIETMAWNHDSSRLAVSYHGGIVTVIDSSTGATRFSNSDFRRASNLAWSPTHPNQLLIGGDIGDIYIGNVTLFDTASGSSIFSVEGSTPRSGEPPVQRTSLREALLGVCCVQWSPDGRTIAVASNAPPNSAIVISDLRLFDGATGKLRTILIDPYGDPDSITSIAWSPDSRKVAASITGNLILIWDTSTGMLVKTLRGHTSTIRDVAWSPDGRYIASSSFILTPEIRIWTPEIDQAVRVFHNLTGTIAWSPDGSELAVGGMRFLQIFDVISGSEIFRLNVDESVKALAYSRYGGRLAFASNPAPPQYRPEGFTPDLILGSSLFGGAVHIIAPAPSPAKFEAVSAACGVTPTETQTLLSAADYLNDIAVRLESISMPTGCLPDLLALAQALQRQ